MKTPPTPTPLPASTADAVMIVVLTIWLIQVICWLAALAGIDLM